MNFLKMFLFVAVAIATLGSFYVQAQEPTPPPEEE